MLSPEPVEIARDLQRPLVGGEEMKHQRDPAIADSRRFFQAEEILEARGERWGLAADILDRDFFAAGQIEGFGGEAVEGLCRALRQCCDESG